MPNWHQLKKEEPDNGERWAILWDTSPRPGAENHNTAVEKTLDEAMDRAKRFLKLGFAVYSIKDPAGKEVMDEKTINTKLKPEPPPVKAPRLPPEPIEPE